MLLRLLPGLLLHHMIPSNIVSLFRVFSLVVVAAMASSLLGVIGELEPSTETFTVYSERLDQFFLLQTILEVIQRVHRKQLSLPQRRNRWP